jgi:2-dehydro-3-deoxygluconokinase
MSLSETKEFDLITLGETMWRLSPPGHFRLETAHQLDVQVAGTESNVAVALSRLGKRVAWWSRLPDNAPGHHVANTLQTYGVDVSGVCWGGSRLGTYYIEFGSSPRPSQVIYDRAGSSASEMRPDDFDWSLLRHTRWLHLTGITPALSPSCLETMRRAIAEARTAGINISFDLNYRGKLWTTVQAQPIMDELAAGCHLVITAERDAKAIFGTSDLPELSQRWNGATVVLTRSAAGATAYDGGTTYDAAAFDVQMVDRLGAGDAFDAGMLSALMDGKPLDEALRYGCAVAALKLTIPGDMALVSRAEVEHLLTSGASTIQR